MSPRNLPWVLWECNDRAKKPWLYWARVLAVIIGLAVAAQIVFTMNASLRMQWRGVLPYLGFSYLLGLVGVIAFFRMGGRSLDVRNLVQERKEGTLALLLCTPRRPMEVVLSKILPTCGMYLGAVVATIPILLWVSWFRIGWLLEAFVVFAWVCSLVVFYVAARVALTCTRMEEKTVHVVAGLLIFAFLVLPPMCRALLYQPWTVWMYLNPVAGIGTTPFWRFPVASVLNLVWAGGCVWVGSWLLTREIYPARGSLGFFWYRLKRRLKRIVPGQACIERWLIEKYPIAWLDLRTFAWVVYPAAILLGIVAAVVALWESPERDMAAVVVGVAAFLAFALVASVRAFVDRTLKSERESRMAEVIHPLPIEARNMAISRLIESAFWVGPSLVLVGTTATIVSVLFLPGMVTLFVVLESTEAVTLAAMVCVGSHLAGRIRKSWFEREHWLLIGVALLVIFVFPLGSIMVAVATDSSVGFFIASMVRVALEALLTRFLFGWLTRKIAKGEDAGLSLA